MSAPAPSSPPKVRDTIADSPVTWADPARGEAFAHWLAAVASRHGLNADSVRLASADASFRRYLRVEASDGSRIVMDAPPAQENCEPFVRIAALMDAAGLHVPQVLEWNREQGFLLLTDLGRQTLLESLPTDRPEACQPLLLQAADALIAWQAASRPGVLPPYDEALLRRELQLFPDWYLDRHRAGSLDDAARETLSRSFNLIVARNLAAPAVYVHRDFMPRNLMRRPAGETPATPAQALGVLDFQDAVHGPVTYDIACLMRDAFHSWEEEFVLDITIRYWEKARKAGLMDFEDWHSDFGAFWRAVEWMGLQRHLKVAGIFARLTLRDGKPKYLADAPRFIGYIRATAGRYRELTPLLRLIDRIEGTAAPTGFAFGRV
jgi:N-acetylmuramate 1-kinase